MFGIGMTEMMLIAVVVLVFFGPQKLPELAQQFGRFFVQMRRMTGDLRESFDDAMRKAEYDVLQEERQKLQKLIEEEAAQLKVDASVSLKKEDSPNKEPPSLG